MTPADALSPRTLAALDQDTLASFLGARRWFGAKGRKIALVEISEVATLSEGEQPSALTRIEVRFADGGVAHHQLPLAIHTGGDPQPALVLARQGDRVIHDAVESEEFRRQLGRAFATRRTVEAEQIRWEFEPLTNIGDIGDLPTRVIGAEQSNTSIIFGDRAIFKLYRRLEPGQNPDVEIGRFLTTRTGFRGTPALLGVLHLRGPEGDAVAGMVQEFLPGSSDGWAHVLATLESHRKSGAQALSADFLARLRALGQLTRELHEALGSVSDDPDFAPEPTREQDLERWRSATERQAASALQNLALQLDHLPATSATAASVLLGRESAVHALLARPLTAAGPRIRHHGDYHLGQVLHTADGGWRIIDFEGEPARPLAERRARHHPLRDVAGMLRSFAYAAAVATMDSPGPARAAWEQAMRHAFLSGYDPSLTADSPQAGLLALFTAEKAFYELAYELGSRPDWVWIPLAGLTELLTS